MALPTVFSPGQVFTAANANLLRSNQYNQTVTTKTTSYTPTTTTDIGTRVIMNSASATTITINTSIYSAGDTFFISNIGVGVCTLTAGTCSITTAGSLAIAQYGGGELYFTSASAAIFYPSAGPTASSGLTFIAKTTITATTQQNLTNVFSTTYDHYVVKFSDLNCGGGLKIRCGTSGTPDTSSNYSSTGVYFDENQRSITANAFNASSSFLVGNTSSSMGTFMDISSPFLTVKTTYQVGNGSLGGASIIGNFVIGTINTSTSYTDLVLLSASNFSGVVSIYGYAKS